MLNPKASGMLSRKVEELSHIQARRLSLPLSTHMRLPQFHEGDSYWSRLGRAHQLCRSRRIVQGEEREVMGHLAGCELGWVSVPRRKRTAQVTRQFRTADRVLIYVAVLTL